MLKVCYDYETCILHPFYVREDDKDIIGVYVNINDDNCIGRLQRV